MRKPEVAIDIVCGCALRRPVEDLLLAWEDNAEFYGPRLLCDSCSEAVIDTYFCPTCLNSFFSSVAISGKLRCGTCLKCPTCCCLLSTIVGDDGKTSLQCPSCGWDSKSIGLNEENIGQVLNCIRSKDGSKAVEDQFASLNQLYGDRHAKMMQMEMEDDDISGMATHAEGGGLRNSVKAINNLEMTMAGVGLSIRLPTDNVKHDFSQDETNKALECSEVTTCQQRLMQARAKYSNKEGWPFFGRLTTKLAFKDPKTDQFLVKPKAGANKTDFDKQCNAHVWLPRVTLLEAPTALTPGQETELVLVFRNNNKTSGATLNLQSTSAYLSKREEDRKVHEAEGVHDDDEVLPSVVDLEDTADVAFALPDGGVPLGKAPEADEEEVKEEGTDHTAFTSQNAVGVKFKVTPKDAATGVAFSLVATVKSERAGDAVTYQIQVTLGPVAA